MTDALRIGESAPRREDPALLRGQGRFFAKYGRADSLHMAVLRSPMAHGMIETLDLEACGRLPGVRLALSAADLPSNGPLPMIDWTEDSLPAGHPVLAQERVLYVGQPVAAVVADTAAAAQAGLGAIRLDILPLQPLTDAAQALAGELTLHGGDNSAQTLIHHVGDPKRAFAAAAYVLEDTFRFHRVGAMPIEPRGAFASFDPSTGRMTLAATTQVPGALRDRVSSLLGIDVEDVDCERLQLGGAFGCKEYVYPEEILVATAVWLLRRPVRWQETRYEHFVAAAHAREGIARLRMALDTGGMVTALDVEGVSDVGAFFGFASNLPGAAMGGMVRGPYRIPNFSARTRSVVTNKTPLNVYRGAGHPQAVFAMERMMDRAADLLGIDRIELRRRNLIDRDAFPVDRGVAYHDAGRIIYDSGDYEKCLDEALDVIGYERFAERRATFEAETSALRLGLGLAMVVELTSTGPDETVGVSVAEDGHVVVSTAAVEMGQRTIGALTQVLSDALGIGPDLIEIRCGSPIGRSGGGAFASRGASVGGAAVAAGAAKLRAAALALYAELTGTAIESLRWEAGGIMDPARRNEPVSLGELRGMAGMAAAGRLSVTGEFKVPRTSFASACHAAIVSVDVETGVTDVLDYAVAHDCGRVLNPRGVEGQIAGGVMQGLGATLFEHLQYAEDGTPLVRGLLDYTLPVAANVPEFHIRHVETLSPLNPLGFKGAGEGGFTGAPASIVAAIEDALREFGLRLTDDGPYTPSRVLGLIRSSSAGTSHKQKARRR